MKITRRDALKVAAGLAIGVALPSIAVADDCVLLDRKDILCSFHMYLDGVKYTRLVTTNTHIFIRESVYDILQQYVDGRTIIKAHEQNNPDAALSERLAWQPMDWPINQSWHFMCSSHVKCDHEVQAYRWERPNDLDWIYKKYILMGKCLVPDDSYGVCCDAKTACLLNRLPFYLGKINERTYSS